MKKALLTTLTLFALLVSIVFAAKQYDQRNFDFIMESSGESYFNPASLKVGLSLHNDMAMIPFTKIRTNGEETFLRVGNLNTRTIRDYGVWESLDGYGFVDDGSILNSISMCVWYAYGSQKEEGASKKLCDSCINEPILLINGQVFVFGEGVTFDGSKLGTSASIGGIQLSSHSLSWWLLVPTFDNPDYGYFLLNGKVYKNVNLRSVERRWVKGSFSKDVFDFYSLTTNASGEEKIRFHTVYVKENDNKYEAFQTNK